MPKPYLWWRNAKPPQEPKVNLAKLLSEEVRQLKRYGGAPDSFIWTGTEEELEQFIKDLKETYDKSH